jgi:DNA-binding IclR family transcriptional regulator
VTGTDNVKAAELCLRILEHVAFSPERDGVTQIAESFGIAKSAAFKHLHTLISRGLVVQDPSTSRYRLGPKAWLIGQQAQSLNDITAIALPFMLAARNETGLAVVLSTPMPASAYVVLTCPSTHQIEIGVRTGSHLALHASAQGKVFLAMGGSNLPELKKTSLTPVTPHTITSWDVLEEELKKVREYGFASAPQEALLGINAMAAPVINYDNKLIASIGFVGSVQHIPDVPDPALVNRLLRLTRDISSAFGHVN